MTIQDDVRKTLSDPTPLYAVAGTADLAIEKLREVPALVEKLREQAPDRIEAVRKTDPKVYQERATERAKEAQAKLSDALGTLDTDIKKLRESAQDLALQGVGRAAEYAVKARETYDELAERGQKAVKEWRGEAAEKIEVTTEVVRPAPEPEVAPKAEPKPEPKAADEPKPAAAKPAAKKTSAAKKPAAKKTTTAKATQTPAKKTASPKNDS
ncbi:hypothetical protein G5C51_09295 [Streptomyces sp. A7024]|uniref:Heparin-binding hemagglutinin n=1 Tax=Streptomyces coryli TaxID=1128680 RepID=A0A6G4TYI6_9ACTN|nr:hypothetical protein [Streptomyces coryli]NGN64097.1 hypothetical protein [Streptomyces coryli]